MSNPFLSYAIFSENGSTDSKSSGYPSASTGSLPNTRIEYCQSIHNALCFFEDCKLSA